ncbi:hydantoinase/oxoprolinase family protein [Streptomyces specialis]|uniref:hydantoinase/oxoprolinase family protein n=1 Tax=Streptomyces specialis TaxID=498367 RepID=UPI00073F6FB2|nr:hydantoinase/oxoprolinase family protein [Streptomyces specialis]
MSSRVGVDVGGTFTDLIMCDDATGEIRVAKRPTTPRAPEKGVLDAVRAGVGTERVGSLAYFLHGTTIGLNALLTREGATVGIITTRGFRDVIELRRGDRTDAFDLFCREPEVLVPRHRRFEVTERVGFRGEVLTPLAEADVRALVPELRAAGVDSVAVVLLHAYANPVHERRVAGLLAEAGFTGQISLSHEVAAEYREYERTTTTTVDAYVRPKTSTYLDALEAGLAGLGCEAEVLVTRSGGGALPLRQARDRPFETIMSGPVAGVQGAAEISRLLGLPYAITADVGGTSFDTALVVDGRPQLQYEGSIEGIPVLAPWVDVRSIGAGGGSVAFVDEGGLLRVGPRSAGASPGPACYGQGGTEPTTTAAACHLGMFGPGQLANGWVLDREAATRSLAGIAERLGLSADDVAAGVIRIAAAAMAGAIREVTVERGIDPRRCALMPFGGAGPLFSGVVADELAIDTTVVPPFAGNFSAWGLLGAEITHTAARTKVLDLGEEAVGQLDALLAELYADLVERAGAQAREETVFEAALDMRYAGQDHALTVGVPLDGRRVAATAAGLEALFTAEYDVQYGHVMDERVQVVATRATLRRPLPRRRVGAPAPRADLPARPSLTAYSFAERRRRDFAVVDRDAVTEVLAGPAIVLEQTTTTYIDAGHEARRDGTSGCLVITRRTRS